LKGSIPKDGQLKSKGPKPDKGAKTPIVRRAKGPKKAILSRLTPRGVKFQSALADFA
jgi:hypothetical protein